MSRNSPTKTSAPNSPAGSPLPTNQFTLNGEQTFPTSRFYFCGLPTHTHLVPPGTLGLDGWSKTKAVINPDLTISKVEADPGTVCRTFLPLPCITDFSRKAEGRVLYPSIIRAIRRQPSTDEELVRALALGSPGWVETHSGSRLNNSVSGKPFGEEAVVFCNRTLDKCCSKDELDQFQRAVKGPTDKSS